MMNISLCKMTKSLCDRYLQGFQHDPDLFMEDQPFAEYVYTQEKSDAYWQRQQDLGRVHMAVMRNHEPVGEIVLKNLDPHTRVCTMGICLQNDSVKNRGYGTWAERMILEYAFRKLGMETVFADALLKNTRSQRVLEKAGFREIQRDESFCYYRCDKSDWIAGHSVP